MNALIANARFHFHERLFETNTLTLTKVGVASNADTSSRGSKAIAGKIVDILVDEHHHIVNTVDKISGQTLGKQFELLTMEFLQETFPHLQNLRPGQWSILQLGNNNRLKTSDFEQYEHLAYLSELTAENAQLAAALGNDYLVAPDVVIYRDLYDDSEINSVQCVVDGDVSKMADIRKANGGKPLLHASVSAKYTMRSDRAQNSRTEALNLMYHDGKKHLGIVVGDQDAVVNSENRIPAYEEFMEENDLGTPRIYTDIKDYSDGYNLYPQLVKDGVDGVIVTRDISSVGILNSAMDAGKKVPEDLEIVTASATQLASVVRPALTTIKQPLYDMGAVAMRMLTKLMNNEEVDDTHIVLPYELVKKQSTLNQ